jgi:hypothetical protein
VTHSFWWLIVDALAVYRLAILITKDTITEPLRDRIIAMPKTWSSPAERISPRPRLAAFITCPWCVSIWIAAAVVALTNFAPTPWQYAALGLALSGVTGFLAER